MTNLPKIFLSACLLMVVAGCAKNTVTRQEIDLGGDTILRLVESNSGATTPFTTEINLHLSNSVETIYKGTGSSCQYDLRVQGKTIFIDGPIHLEMSSKKEAYGYKVVLSKTIWNIKKRIVNSSKKIEAIIFEDHCLGRNRQLGTRLLINREVGRVSYFNDTSFHHRWIFAYQGSAAGIKQVRWISENTLEIQHDVPKHLILDNEEVWGDVKIVYRKN